MICRFLPLPGRAFFAPAGAGVLFPRGKSTKSSLKGGAAPLENPPNYGGNYLRYDLGDCPSPAGSMGRQWAKRWRLRPIAHAYCGAGIANGGQQRLNPVRRGFHDSNFKVRCNSLLGSPAALARYLAQASTCFSAYKLGGLSSLKWGAEKAESCYVRCNPRKYFRAWAAKARSNGRKSGAVPGRPRC